MPFNNNLVSNVSESSDHSLIYVSHLEQPLLSITAIFLPLIIVGTTLGNVMVIKAIFGEPTLRQAQNYPLASLAVADLLTATVVMTQGAMYEVLQYWPLSIPLCYFWIVTDVFLCTASILNICLIGIDRYLAISRPIWYAQVRRPPLAVLGIAIAWTGSALVAFPPLCGWIHLEFTPVEGFFGQGYRACDYPTDKLYVFFSSMFSFIIPMVVLLITYFRIYKVAKVRIQKRRDSLPKVSESEKARIRKEIGSSMAAAAAMNEKKPLKGHGASLNPNRSGYHSSVRRKLSFLRSKEEHENSALSHNHLSPENIKDDPSIFCVSPRPPSLMIPEPDIAKNQSQHTANGDPAPSGEACQTPKSVVEFVVQMEKICVRKERKAAAVLGVILLLFFICWLPFFIIYICESYAPDVYRDKRPIKLYATIVWLGYVNSMLNPLVYGCMNVNFRRSFAKTLGFKARYNPAPGF